MGGKTKAEQAKRAARREKAAAAAAADGGQVAPKQKRQRKGEAPAAGGSAAGSQEGQAVPVPEVAQGDQVQAQVGLGGFPANDEAMQSEDPPPVAGDEAFIALLEKSHELEAEIQTLKKKNERLVDNELKGAAAFDIRMIQLSGIIEKLHETAEEANIKASEYKAKYDFLVQQVQPPVGQARIEELEAELKKLQTQHKPAGKSAKAVKGKSEKKQLPEDVVELQKQVEYLQKYSDALHDDAKIIEAVCKEDEESASKQLAWHTIRYRTVTDPSTVRGTSETVKGVHPVPECQLRSSVTMAVLVDTTVVHVPEESFAEHQLNRPVTMCLNASGITKSSFEEELLEHIMNISAGPRLTLGAADKSLLFPVVYRSTVAYGEHPPGKRAFIELGGKRQAMSNQGKNRVFALTGEYVIVPGGWASPSMLHKAETMCFHEDRHVGRSVLSDYFHDNKISLDMAEKEDVQAGTVVWRIIRKRSKKGGQEEKGIYHPSKLVTWGIPSHDDDVSDVSDDEPKGGSSKGQGGASKGQGGASKKRRSEDDSEEDDSD
jgi:hypothetical protein